MIDGFEYELNKMLVETYKLILKVEENTINSLKESDLTINAIHLLEAVGSSDEGVTISDIAQMLDITLPSVTAFVNKLEKKGYVNKVRCGEDGRRVLVSLTKQGNRVVAAHTYFHEQMVKNISKVFNNNEKEVLLVCIDKLNGFFRKNAAKGGGKK